MLPRLRPMDGGKQPRAKLSCQRDASDIVALSEKDGFFLQCYRDHSAQHPEERSAFYGMQGVPRFHRDNRSHQLARLLPFAVAFSTPLGSGFRWA